ncbi:MAG: hypothetical protein DIU60_006150 [Actinomycetes bacterium]|jgi:hypothetical protein|nr:MAG: hypothetical protein DIU60_08840 [Actinomycetota bacterium]
MSTSQLELTGVAEKTADPQVMKDVANALHSMRGYTEFAAAANGFLKGDIDLERAVEAMIPFLQGEICKGADQRERLLQLGQTLQEKCGWVSITASITGCTPAFSCSIICC